MPSKRHQFNIVLDDATEGLVWKLAGKHRKKPNELLRRLIATHPEIQAEAEIEGITPQPETTGWGGRREVKENA